MSLGSGASWTANQYVVTQGVILENITLRIRVHIEPFLKTGIYFNVPHYVSARLIKQSYPSGLETILDEITQQLVPLPSNSYLGSLDTPFPNIDFDYSILPQNLQPDDRIFIRAQYSTPNLYPSQPVPSVGYKPNTSYFNVSQIPSPTNTQVTSSGTNSLWGYPDNTKLYAITSSNPILNDLYDQGFKQIDITGSGFNPIVLPWSIKYGDEFRFEGNENSTFVVKKVYNVAEIDNERVSQTGSIEVQFGGLLPSASINLDHFLIRRYVDDAAQILIEGFRPSDTGPYIITPEYVTPSLNKNIDTFITDLTQKGLL
jgi:hypothetical protein